MKKFIVSLMIICLTFGVVYATAPGSIEAVITDTTIMIEALPINSHLENPLLSYNDRTYIAVRDMAKILNQEIIWDEEYNTVEMFDKKYPVDNYVITNRDDALEIGKVIIKRFFPDDVTDKTVYEVGYCEMDHLGAKPSYEIDVKFDENSTNERDASVTIDAQSGEVLGITKYEGKKQTRIYPVEN